MTSHLWHKILIGLFIITLAASSPRPVAAADKDLASSRKAIHREQVHSMAPPIVEDDWYVHRIGNLWQRVTNYGKMGDDSYDDPDPSCDFPGGSGNSYLYRGSPWITAVIDDVPHTSTPEDQEFAPIDSVHVITGENARSEEDTYTSYYDVQAPLSTGHVPLGVEIIERTFAWSGSFAGDFIIYEYVITNVGIDTDDDNFPDSTRDLEQVYFTMRLDADVSKLATWDVEYRFSNQDDHVMANGVPWEWLELFPNTAGRDHGLTDADLDSTLMFMFDGDNYQYPSDQEGVDNDFGNPGPDGTLQTPGFIGFKILKTEPYLPPSSFHVNHIANDPANDQEIWDRMVGNPGFEDFSPLPSVPGSEVPLPHDYRGLLTFGPADILKDGDSLKIIAALAVGSDPDSGGVYSLLELIETMDHAQLIVDNDFDMTALIDAPSAPMVEVGEYVEDQEVRGVQVVWDETPALHQNFQAFKVWKSSSKTAAGAFDWQPLGLGTYVDSVGSTSWPPPAGDEAGTYRIIDEDVINGLDYFYTVQSITIEITEPIYAGVLETNLLDANSFQSISPANPVAANLDNVLVVPNPYVGSERWNNPFPSDTFPWEHRVQFTNLPADATVKIFTLDGDFVAEIQAGESVRRGEETTSAPPQSVAEWDLMTRNNQEAAPGIYLFVVESPSLGETIGKFVIIR
jgi:hypothetical protein